MNGTNKIAHTKEEIVCDVVVIGGGASGMMAAGVAASSGKNVLLLEKNKTLGSKLLISGGGRCNVTNNKENVREMVECYKGSSQFLFSPFSVFGVREAKTFFLSQGVSFVEENDGRLFPSTHSSKTIYNALLSYMDKGGVHIRTSEKVLSIIKESGTDLFVVTTDTTSVRASSCVVATGGLSHPETGSTGDGFTFVKRLGVPIKESSYALVPVALKESWVPRVAGVVFDECWVNVFVHNKRVIKKKGRVLFSHVGITGPTVLSLSKAIGELIPEGDVTIGLDLFPSLDIPDVKKLLHDIFVKESNKKVKNVLGLIFPKAFVPIVLETLRIDGEGFVHSLSKEHRASLALYCKTVLLTVSHILGKDKAVISSGGVPCEEIDFRTMESKKVKKLYITGDLLDIDRPSGGYSLQLCWTTGYLAGISSVG